MSAMAPKLMEERIQITYEWNFFLSVICMRFVILLVPRDKFIAASLQPIIQALRALHLALDGLHIHLGMTAERPAARQSTV